MKGKRFKVIWVGQGQTQELVGTGTTYGLCRAFVNRHGRDAEYAAGKFHIVPEHYYYPRSRRVIVR